MEKITRKVALEVAIKTLEGANVEAKDEVIAKLNGMIEALEKKSGSASTKPTAKQVENAGIKSTVLEVLKGTTAPKTITELLEMSPDFEGMSNQRMTALVNQLVREGSVLRNKEGRKSVFSAA